MVDKISVSLPNVVVSEIHKEMELNNSKNRSEIIEELLREALLARKIKRGELKSE